MSRPFMLLLLCVGCLLGSFATREARAHEVRPVSLELRELEGHRYQVDWQRPARGDAVLRVIPTFPEDCAMQTNRSRVVSGRALDSAIISCEESLSGREVYLEGLERTLTDALVTVRLRTGDVQSQLLRGDRPSFEVARAPTRGEVAAGYVRLGVEHILFGIDHLLFVLGLLLILSEWKQLAAAITSFTVAHSITLALASLDVVRVPQAPVEAIIALSIVFLAAEYARKLDGEKGWTERRPWSVSFIVGLLHGLGFAGALAEVGLPQSEIPLALFSFNVGVELGQLAFVLTVLGLMWAVSRFVTVASRPAGLTAAYGMGSVAGFWFISRAVALL